MRKIVYAFLCVFIHEAFSQDLLVTNKGDSINCRILDRDSLIQFIELKNKKKIKTYILVDKITNINLGYYKKINLDYFRFNKLDKFTNIQLSYGKGISISEVPKIGEYKGSTQNDIFRINITSYKNKVGFGIDWINYKSSNAFDNINRSILTNYLATTVCYRFVLKGFMFNIGGGIGWLNVNDITKIASTYSKYYFSTTQVLTSEGENMQIPVASKYNYTNYSYITFESNNIGLLGNLNVITHLIGNFYFTSNISYLHGFLNMKSQNKNFNYKNSTIDIVNLNIGVCIKINK